MTTTYVICDYAAPLRAIDQVLEINDHQIRTAKAISGNEPFFPGHYPGYPIFPGNFILEAVHQAVRHYTANYPNLSLQARLTELQSIRFLSPLFPGDRLEVVCQCVVSPGQDELLADANCLNKNGEVVAKVKLRYVLDE